VVGGSNPPIPTIKNEVTKKKLLRASFFTGNTGVSGQLVRDKAYQDYFYQNKQPQRI
jgi:hypothetical protein